MRTLSPLRTIFAIIAIALLFVLATFALPNNAYQRYNQFGGTIYANLGWIYERIHFDPAPVDIAVVGSSRTMLAISAPKLEANLAARGINAKVANFSIVGSGRNINAMIVDELFTAKKPKLIIVEVDETQYRYGHPAYDFAAPTRDILTQPFGLHDQPRQLFYLPYRNIKLFLAAILPQTFGIPAQFDASKYRGTTPETAKSFLLVPGRYIEMDKQIPVPELLKGARDSEKGKGPSRLPKPIADRYFGDDRVYIQSIVDAAHRHGAQVAFVFIPYYSGPTTIAARDFYAARGQVLDANFFADQDTQYQGWAHLNRAGALKMTDWLSTQIAPLLEAKP